MNDHSTEPSGGSFWLSVVGIIGCFLLFVAVLYVSYLPNRTSVDAGAPIFSASDLKQFAGLPPDERAKALADLRWERKLPTPEDRKAKLVELRHKDAQILSGYTWIDQEKGVVHLPIARAIELTVQDLQRPAGRN